MENGWQQSAAAWIEAQGERGDFGRRYVLDRVMLPRALARAPASALDVGCGEGRFCRLLSAQGVTCTGIDPTPALIAQARALDSQSRYEEASAESLPFADASFDLVVSYLSLIDIPDITRAIPEMARVLKPGGALVIANLSSFNTACGDQGWVRDAKGAKLHYPVDNYSNERSMWIAYRAIRIVNHHRPLSAYMKLFLNSGLRLTYFDEPLPGPDAPEPQASSYRRVPWFVVMEWEKAVSALGAARSRRSRGRIDSSLGTA